MLNSSPRTSSSSRLTAAIAADNNVTQVRLQLYIPLCYQQEPVISRLISHHDLLINITGAVLSPTTQSLGRLDLEIRGTPQNIHSGLMYLQSLNIKLIGKPNAEGDSWHH